MSKKVLIALLSVFICCSVWSCSGDDKEEKGKKAKKEQTTNPETDQKGAKKKDKKDSKGPSKPGISVPADNDNDQVTAKISGKKWKLSKWQRSSKKTDKAPAFLWSFNDDGSVAIGINKGKKIDGKWAFVAAENKMYISLPGGGKKGSALNSFSEPFEVVSMSDTEMKLKNSQSELTFASN